MRVLVAYASRHGATQGIAERIAERLRADGLESEARPARTIQDVAGYDAVIAGSASYMFHWLKDASSFVRRHQAALVARPLWLFSSGPLGTEPIDDQGRDQKEAAVPRELPDLVSALGARDHRVFFGAYRRDRRPIGLAERVVAMMPAARDALPEGDFRDWADIDAWADGIAADLRGATD